jgi:hypothetical protein
MVVLTGELEENDEQDYVTRLTGTETRRGKRQATFKVRHVIPRFGNPKSVCMNLNTSPRHPPILHTVNTRIWYVTSLHCINEI